MGRGHGATGSIGGILGVLGACALGCAAPPGESRFPAAEPSMPMVTYYDPRVEGPLGPPIKEGALIVDPPPEELPS